MEFIFCWWCINCSRSSEQEVNGESIWLIDWLIELDSLWNIVLITWLIIILFKKKSQDAQKRFHWFIKIDANNRNALLQLCLNSTDVAW